MIYTLTANPNVDCFLYFEETAELGKINRAVKQEFYPGGKGVNVALVLQELGQRVCAMGFLAGQSGKLFLDLFEKTRCEGTFIWLPRGQTRVNVKLVQEPETAFNAAGPELDEDALSQLLTKLQRICADDTVVISGNLQPGAANAYERVAQLVSSRGARLVVDAQKDALKSTLAYHPFLIKPNLEELGQLFDTQVSDIPQVIALARRLQTDGAQNVLVSMAERGAVFVGSGDEVYHAWPDGPFEIVSSVGAGDSQLAAFLASWLKEENFEKAVRFSIAAGTAAACSCHLAQKDCIEQILPRIKLREIQIKGGNETHGKH